ncbi:PilZ domain-containing protein [Desulfococcaceae bacterium HSG8]|nr:PilZ domain-containing protein [Desulfococcaceae bacterium HSG8]
MKHEINQREFPRILKEIPIEVARISYPVSEKPEKKCLSKNIGGGGICFTLRTPYEVGALLNLKISIPGWQSYKRPFSLFWDMSSDAPLTAVGEVVWCRKFPGGYDVGIRFLDIYEDDYNALMKYLENQNQ